MLLYFFFQLCLLTELKIYLNACLQPCFNGHTNITQITQFLYPEGKYI